MAESAATRKKDADVPAGGSEPVSKTSHWVLPIVAVVLALLAYCATVRFAFVFDDRSQIVANPILHSWRYFTLYFTQNVWQHSHPEVVANYYRPLPQVWKLMHYSLFGLNPFWWHASNVTLHLLVTVMVFALAKRLTRDGFVAGVSGILFGIHPIHIEAVAWVSGVTDVLLTLLLIASLLCCMESRRRDENRRLTPRTYVCSSVLLYGLATLTKVTALVFPALIFLYEYLYGLQDLSENPCARSRLRRLESALKASVSYLAVSAIYIAVRVQVLKGFAHNATPIPVRTIILTLPSILWFYLKSLIYPAQLGPYYDIPLIDKADLTHVALPLLGLCAACLFVRLMAKRSGLTLLLSALMILPLLPVSNLSVFSAGDICHDRYLYLPSVGFSILVAGFVRRLAGSSRAGLFGEPVPQVLAALGISCALAVLTINQEQFWRDDLALYSRGVVSAPVSTAAANNLALALLEKGSPLGALDLLKSANARDPNHWICSYNLGFVYYKLGKDDEAEKYLSNALALNPDSAKTNFILGLVLMESNRLDAAELSIDRAIAIGPIQRGFYYGQGTVLERLGKTSQALDSYKKELASFPDQADLIAKIKSIDEKAPISDKPNRSPDSETRTSEELVTKEPTK